jgi:hypothetical protein
MSRRYEDDDGDELDIRIRRGRAPRPTPIIYPDRDANSRRGSSTTQPIYPRRPLRRASTLPVRFEDGSSEFRSVDGQEGGSQSKPQNDSAGRRPSIPDEEAVVIEEHSPVRSSRYVDDDYSSDEEGITIPRYGRDVDDEPNADAYSFSLSRHTRSLLSRDSSAGSISDISESDILDPPSGPNCNDPHAGNILRVFGSNYAGDGLIESLQTAELKVSQDTGQAPRSGPQPMFRWVQFEDINMNFDKFESGCSRIPGLTDGEKSAISKAFTRVRRKYSKSFQTSGGTKVGLLQPGLYQHTGLAEPGKGKQQTRTVTWMCFPYFCLQKYSGALVGLPPSSYPIRTLLQTRFSSVRKERDMRQAVCQLQDTLD